MAGCLYNEMHISGLFVQIHSFHELHMVVDWRGGSRAAEIFQRNLPTMKSFWDCSTTEKETYVVDVFKSFFESIASVFGVVGKEVVGIQTEASVVELKNCKEEIYEIWASEVQLNKKQSYRAVNRLGFRFE